MSDLLPTMYIQSVNCGPCWSFENELWAKVCCFGAKILFSAKVSRTHTLCVCVRETYSPRTHTLCVCVRGEYGGGESGASMEFFAGAKK